MLQNAGLNSYKKRLGNGLHIFMHHSSPLVTWTRTDRKQQPRDTLLTWIEAILHFGQVDKYTSYMFSSETGLLGECCCYVEDVDDLNV